MSYACDCDSLSSSIRAQQSDEPLCAGAKTCRTPRAGEALLSPQPYPLCRVRVLMLSLRFGDSSHLEKNHIPSIRLNFSQGSSGRRQYSSNRQQASGPWVPSSILAVARGLTGGAPAWQGQSHGKVSSDCALQ
ncbi:hypothetical protein VULLAG_LOCUS1085 [Vulpes lagopus]